MIKSMKKLIQEINTECNRNGHFRNVNTKGFTVIPFEGSIFIKRNMTPSQTAVTTIKRKEKSWAWKLFDKYQNVLKNDNLQQVTTLSSNVLKQPKKSYALCNATTYSLCKLN